jgi:hypothetical protein
MTRDRTLTEKLALSILARDGIAAVWQLHMAAAAAYRTGIRSLRLPFWKSPTPRKQLGSGPKAYGSLHHAHRNARSTWCAIPQQPRVELETLL